MTFNNETNLVIGNKHNNEQQQHEHRTGKDHQRKKKSPRRSFPQGMKINVNMDETDILIQLIDLTIIYLYFRSSNHRL